MNCVYLGHQINLMDGAKGECGRRRKAALCSFNRTLSVLEDDNLTMKLRDLSQRFRPLSYGTKCKPPQNADQKKLAVTQRAMKHQIRKKYFSTITLNIRKSATCTNFDEIRREIGRGTWHICRTTVWHPLDQKRLHGRRRIRWCELMIQIVW